MGLLGLEPTLTTLLLYTIIPFAFFGYRRGYWYRPDKVRRFDYTLAAVGVILILDIVTLLLKGFGGHNLEQKKLVLLHLLPLVQILLLVFGDWGMVSNPLLRALGGNDKAQGGSTYNPSPIHDEVEKLSWDDIVIDDAVKQELTSVVELLRDSKKARAYGVQTPRGILLAGPPGTGKTTIAKVMANQAKLSFFVLKMDEIVSKWVGESEKNLSKLFDAATRYAPSVIFIDEIDSIGRSRSGNQAWADNLVNHLLQLINGVLSRDGVYIIGATNRADLIDDALKRAGRLNKVIEIGLPGFDARKKLFELYLSKLKLGEAVDMDALSKLTDKKSPADIKEICNRAGLNAFKRESSSGKRDYKVMRRDLAEALDAIID